MSILKLIIYKFWKKSNHLAPLCTKPRTVTVAVLDQTHSSWILVIARPCDTRHLGVRFELGQKYFWAPRIFRKWGFYGHFNAYSTQFHYIHFFSGTKNRITEALLYYLLEDDAFFHFKYSLLVFHSFTQSHYTLVTRWGISSRARHNWLFDYLKLIIKFSRVGSNTVPLVIHVHSVKVSTLWLT